MGPPPLSYHGPMDSEDTAGRRAGPREARGPGGPAAAARVPGFDLARALAVLGMVVVNFKLVLTADGGGAGDPAWLVALTSLDGRAAATFVVLAGIGVSLGSRRARLAQGPEAAPARALARRRLLARAALLFVVGLAYLPVWPADILHVYGVFLALGAALLFASTRALLGAAAGLVLLFPLLAAVLDYEAGWDWETLEYEGLWTAAGMVRHLVFNGFHPVVPWAAFLLVGMGLGRLDWTRPGLSARVALGGAAGLLAASLPGWLLGDAAAGLVDPEARELATLLLGTHPMPPLPLYLVSGTSAACSVIGLAVLVTPRLGAAARPLVATGQLALTLYVAHVVLGIGAFEVLGLLGGLSLGQATAAALAFFALAVLSATLWLRRFSRGPLEAAFRRVVERVAPAGTRPGAGGERGA